VTKKAATILMLGLACTGVAQSACQDLEGLRDQYKAISLQISQVGFKLAQLALPLTHPTSIQLYGEVERLREARAKVAQQIQACEQQN